MKMVSRVTIGLGLLLGSGVCAMAGVAFTQNDKVVDTIESFFVDGTAPANEGDFTDTQADIYLPATIFANTGVSKYTDLYLASIPISEGGKTGLSSNVLPLAGDHIASVTNFVATPEPSGLPLLGAGAIVMGLLVRRNLLRVSY
jgi:hypothetical protein